MQFNSLHSVQRCTLQANDANSRRHAMLSTPMTRFKLAITAAGLSLVMPLSAASQELTVVSFGGSYQEAQSKALFVPAAKALGIKLKEETYTGIADLRLKVKAGAVTWDIVTSGSGVGMASYLGMRLGQQVLGLAEGRTAFDGLPFETRPLYSGNPWFLAPSIFYYRWRDRRTA